MMDYYLRVVIFPDSWETQCETLIHFCHRTGVGRVLFMEQSHQIVMTPEPLEKHRRMARLYREIGRRLRAQGISFGINLATLVGHLDAEIAQEQRLPFQKFVGASLREAAACCCVLDGRWQDYAAEVCAIYAACEPESLWIDDDFRSLNHSEAIGCFCPLHAAKTARAIDRELSPKLLRDGVLAGEREIREAWMRVNFQGQREAAQRMRKAAERVNPAVRLGLMNSGEPAHSVQGRDMAVLLRDFAGEGKRPLSRPAGGGYADVLHGQIFRMHHTMALSMSMLEPGTEVVSEVENWPHTRFTKSVHETELQMELHALAGADGISLNLFDYLGTPFGREPCWEALLKREIPRLERISEARRGGKLKGIGIPWKKETAQFGRLPPDRSAERILSQFGLPVQFSAGDCNMLLGEAVLAYSDEELTAFLQKGLLLDGAAAGILCERGFQTLLGVSIRGEIKEPSVERLTDGRFSGVFQGDLLPTNWFRLHQDRIEIKRLVPESEATVLSVICSQELEELAPGVVLYQNALGGRVAVCSVPVGEWQWLYRSRAFQMGQIFEWLNRGSFAVRVEDCPNVGPIYYEAPDETHGLLAVVNTGLDPVWATLHAAGSLKELFTGKPAGGRIYLDALSVSFYQLYQS